MNFKEPRAFWTRLEDLARSHAIVIDRPSGQPHPRYPDLIYPLDYGYLDGTSSADGEGIDVWIGSQPDRALTGILCTIDPAKSDVEIKLLLGCTPVEVTTIIQFNAAHVPNLFVANPGGDPWP